MTTTIYPIAMETDKKCGNLFTLGQVEWLQPMAAEPQVAIASPRRGDTDTTTSNTIGQEVPSKFSLEFTMKKHLGTSIFFQEFVVCDNNKNCACFLSWRMIAHGLSVCINLLFMRFLFSHHEIFVAFF